MHWKLKAAAQNVLARLPHAWSHAAYYRLQRRYGGLRRVDPTSRFDAAIHAWRLIQQQGVDPRGKTFFELGTGRAVNVPTAYWLMGAARTITVDLNRYLKPELVQESLRYVAANHGRVAEQFGGLIDRRRLATAVAFGRQKRPRVEAFLRTAGIQYHAPADAAATGLPAGSVDLHTSFTVLEHVPPDALPRIFAEAQRLLAPGGLLVHGIDYSDHFSHGDPRITAVNFLRYTPAAWRRWSGNRYMYMNRLRHADYLRLMQAAGLPVLRQESVTNARALQALTTGAVPVDPAYAGTPAEDLAKTSGWIVAASQNVAARRAA
ncbi:MAG: class I SAM-dependent methyltransferase [Planctomycetota bacterium]